MALSLGLSLILIRIKFILIILLILTLPWEVQKMSNKKFLVIHHTVGPDPKDARYHVVIDRAGVPRFAALPEAPVSATYLYNTHTVNLALVGNFEIEQPTKKQIDTLVQILVAWCWRLSLKASDITYHGWIGESAPGGPRYTTACCGHNLINQLPSIKRRVAQYLLKDPKGEKVKR